MCWRCGSSLDSVGGKSAVRFDRWPAGFAAVSGCDAGLRATFPCRRGPTRIRPASTQEANSLW